MKRFMKPVTAADEGNSKLLETLDAVKEDFDYIISGLEKLDRSGAEASNQGLIIAEGLQGTLQDVISQIADSVAE